MTGKAGDIFELPTKAMHTPEKLIKNLVAQTPYFPKFFALDDPSIGDCKDEKDFLAAFALTCATSHWDVDSDDEIVEFRTRTFNVRDYVYQSHLMANQIAAIYREIKKNAEIEIGRLALRRLDKGLAPTAFFETSERRHLYGTWELHELAGDFYWTFRNKIRWKRV